MAAKVAQLLVPVAIRDMCMPHDVNQRSPSEWEVTAGLPLQVFLEAVGPAAITRCNLHVHKPFAALATASNWLRAQQHTTSCNTSATTYTSHSLSDVYTLSPAGVAEAACRKRRKLTDPVVLRGTLYCSGTTDVGSRRLLAVKDSTGPNCLRKCGGLGQCVQGCNGAGLGHKCQFHVMLSASLTQVSDGKVTVKVAGTHVPIGTTWVCVHPLALTPSALVKNQLVQNATTFGQTATAVVNKSAGKRVSLILVGSRNSALPHGHPVTPCSCY